MRKRAKVGGFFGITKSWDGQASQLLFPSQCLGGKLSFDAHHSCRQKFRYQNIKKDFEWSVARQRLNHAAYPQKTVWNSRFRAQQLRTDKINQ